MLSVSPLTSWESERTSRSAASNVVAGGYTRGARSERAHSARERCLESLEMGRPALWGETEDPKDFMTVLMSGLGLEGCMPGKG